ncbi:LPXTG cell wall anchor domain-containing protein, partial [Herbidospora galbida]|uniref:LPXTG cell wall anchor domain-containing protein n=1 Tax=Herbidospora galbida TaxID=2575442 RepID=UPI001BB0AD78
RARDGATPAPVPQRGIGRRVPDGAPQTGGGVPAALPLGGVLLVAGAATGFVALRRRSAA